MPFAMATTIIFVILCSSSLLVFVYFAGGHFDDAGFINHGSHRHFGRPASATRNLATEFSREGIGEVEEANALADIEALSKEIRSRINKLHFNNQHRLPVVRMKRDLDKFIQDLANVTNNDVAKENKEYVKPTWPPLSTLVLISLVLGYCCCIGMFCYFGINDDSGMDCRILPRLCFCGVQMANDYVRVRGTPAVDQDLLFFIRGELTLGNFSTICAAALGAWFIQCPTTPSWLTSIGLLIVFRSKLIELRLLSKNGGGLRCPEVFDFTLGALELQDRWTDGLTVPMMFACDEEVHEKFVQSFRESSYLLVQSFAPVADLLHLWGIAALLLFLSAVAQQVCGSFLNSAKLFETGGDGEEHIATCADMLGLGAFAGRMCGEGSLFSIENTRVEGDTVIRISDLFEDDGTEVSESQKNENSFSLGVARMEVLGGRPMIKCHIYYRATYEYRSYFLDELFRFPIAGESAAISQRRRQQVAEIEKILRPMQIKGRASRAVILGVSRAGLENATQGLASSSFLMFMGTPLSAQPMVAVSSILSTFCLLKKGMELIRTAPTLLGEFYFPRLALATALSGLCCTVLSVWIAAKLYFIEACPHQYWGLTTGCIG